MLYPNRMFRVFNSGFKIKEDFWQAKIYFSYKTYKLLLTSYTSTDILTIWSNTGKQLLDLVLVLHFIGRYWRILSHGVHI